MSLISVRNRIAMVGQEPVLFNRTISENITYGLEKVIEDINVIEAAKTANIHEFIASLPDVRINSV